MPSYTLNLTTTDTKLLKHNYSTKEISCTIHYTELHLYAIFNQAMIKCLKHMNFCFLL